MYTTNLLRPSDCMKFKHVHKRPLTADKVFQLRHHKESWDVPCLRNAKDVNHDHKQIIILLRSLRHATWSGGQAYPWPDDACLFILQLLLQTGKREAERAQSRPTGRSLVRKEARQTPVVAGGFWRPYQSDTYCYPGTTELRAMGENVLSLIQQEWVSVYTLQREWSN